VRIAVLGGAGFMGSSFVRYVLSTHQDTEVLVYDKLTYAGRLENLHGVLEDPRLRFVRGDVRNEELLEHVFNEFQPELVVNFAAETHVDRSINEPAPFLETNVFGVFTVLEVARRLGIERYVHISTDEVYGDLWGIEGAADEAWSLNPSSPYSASKAAGDLLVKAYGRTYGLRYRIVRPCNNYGPYQHPEKLIPRTIVRLLHGKPATVYGDGSQVRDWLYVEDFSRALDTVIAGGSDYEVYNVCAHQFAAVRDIVARIVEIMGRDPAKDVVYVRGRPGEDRRYAMNCDKLRNLGWRPRVTLDEGLRKTVEWYLRNEWWWKPLLDQTYVLADEPWRVGK
jgi:dTDP-glucose 4,6-dehydratase